MARTMRATAAVVAALILTAFAAGPASADPLPGSGTRTVWVVAADLRLHARPSSDSPVTVRALEGSSAAYAGEARGSWVRVRIGGTDAWTPARFLTTVKPAWQARPVWVMRERVRLRSRPTNTSPVVATTFRAERGRLTGISRGGWAQVKYRGRFAWVRASAISTAPRFPTTSTLVLVNKRNPLDPRDHVPSNLVTVAGSSSLRLRGAAAAAMARMRSAAAADGVSFTVISAYRSYATQRSLYARYVANLGQAAADRVSARAGYSEHQTGLTADLSSGGGCRLGACFGDTAAGRWVRANGHRFGFIVRYPDGYSSITGYSYEPWHVRYVGPDVATAMRDGGHATYEQYLGRPAAPTY
ncbi:D-alanyl-D-alanine carboxypeptidase family protein [Demequina iriomotensis]|uniref:D-alanyl-D-alanine carboxypeptidase family protein n=1 Tax=Demequina iriomotensis TaxID=1536641 RepID=UPI000AF12262|nr:D-alanyl-D-alanine carboxypeptidase family protein [Demequina iriomotensis]